MRLLSQPCAGQAKKAKGGAGNDDSGSAAAAAAAEPPVDEGMRSRLRRPTSSNQVDISANISTTTCHCLVCFWFAALECLVAMAAFSVSWPAPACSWTGSAS